MKLKFLVLFILLSGYMTTVSAQKIQLVVRQIVEAPKDINKFHLYLLIGQSNMAGRGVVEPQDTVPNVRVLRLNKNNQWEIAKDPIHFDKSEAGDGPGFTFGKVMASQDTTITIGLIPCAVGGSGINSWKTGSYFAGMKTYPYDEAIKRAKEAMHSGILKGIIWHQGESDSNPGKCVEYGTKLKQLIETIRKDLDTPLLPFVAGQLPDYQINRKDKSGNIINNSSAITVNNAISSLVIEKYAFITAEGTNDKGDQTHFNAVSARLMGQRFAEAMIKLGK